MCAVAPGIFTAAKAGKHRPSTVPRSILTWATNRSGITSAEITPSRLAHTDVYLASLRTMAAEEAIRRTTHNQWRPKQRRGSPDRSIRICARTTRTAPKRHRATPQCEGLAFGAHAPKRLDWIGLARQRMVRNSSRERWAELLFQRSVSQLLPPGGMPPTRKLRHSMMNSRKGLALVSSARACSACSLWLDHPGSRHVASRHQRPQTPNGLNTAGSSKNNGRCLAVRVLVMISFRSPNFG